MLTRPTITERGMLVERLMNAYTREQLRYIATAYGIQRGRTKKATATQIASRAEQLEVSFTFAGALKKVPNNWPTQGIKARHSGGFGQPEQLVLFV
jgi:hypothetical protein